MIDQNLKPTKPADLQIGDIIYVQYGHDFERGVVIAMKDDTPLVDIRYAKIKLEGYRDWYFVSNKKQPFDLAKYLRGFITRT